MSIELIWVILLILILVFFTIIFINSVINSIIYWVPQVWTFWSDIEIMKLWLQKYNLSWKKIVDLWSWTWKSLRFFEKNFKMKTSWYEVDFSNYLISKILNKIFWLHSKIVRSDFLKAKLDEYEFIYLYLFPELMIKLEDFIFSQSKKWTIIFSNAFNFKNRIPIEILLGKNWKEEVYIYKV